jgi:prepilin-type N-terminal cleavage/methylation domain-containing protein
MNKNLKKHQHGMTLIELLVASVLTIFLAGGAIMVHLAGRQASIDAEQMSRMQENVRFASDYIVRDVRNAGFRDEVYLKIGHEEQIRQAYATILDDTAIADSGNRLRIRYAGRGHCTEAFQTFRLVENEYFLNENTGELSCRGRSLLQSDVGTKSIDDDTLWGDSIGLVRGVRSLQFDKLSVGNVACVFDLETWEVDPSATTLCTGIRITVELQGMQDLDSPGVTNSRTATLSAAFRNVILEIINHNAYATGT